MRDNDLRIFSFTYGQTAEALESLEKFLALISNPNIHSNALKNIHKELYDEAIVQLNYGSDVSTARGLMYRGIVELLEHLHPKVFEK